MAHQWPPREEVQQPPAWTPPGGGSVAPPPPAPRQGGSCLRLFLGCLFALVAISVVITIALVAGFYFMRAGLEQLVAEYTETEPMALPSADLPSETADALAARLEAFQAAIEARESGAELTLTGPELNAVLQEQAAGTPFAGTFHIDIDGDTVVGQVSVPLGEVLPFRVGMFEGRYLNGDARFIVSLLRGRPAAYIESLEVGGKTLPDEVMEQIRAHNLLQDVQLDREARAALEAIDELRIAGGRMSIRVR